MKIKKSHSSKRFTNLELFKDLEQNKNRAESLITEIKQMNKEIKFKHFLNDKKLSPKEFIKKALKIGLCITEKNNINSHNKNKISEILKEIKENAKVKYISNESEKNKNNLNEEFEEILDKCNEKARIKLNNYFDDLIEIKNEQTMLIIENQNLESKIENLNNNFQAFKKRLSEKHFELNKIIKKLDSYEKVKPFFELIRKFPKEDQKQIMSLFFNNKNKLIDYIHKINNSNEEYKDINKLRKKEQIKEAKFKENIIEKINEQNNFFNYKNKIIELDILNHEKHYEMIQKIKEEGNKYKKLLLFIYNSIKKFIPEKNYNLFINEMKNIHIISEENFDYSIFSNQNYINLIRNCIINKVSKCNEGVLLRNTITFGNYLSRKYLNSNKNENYRYNPLKAYKDFKIYFDKINIKNFSLKRKLNYLKSQLDELKKEKISMENILNKWEIKYNVLLDNSEISSILQKNDKNRKDDKIFEKSKLNHLIKRKNSKKLSEEVKIIFDDNNNEKLSISNDKNINKFFLTDINKHFKKDKTKYKKCLSNENFETMKNELNNITISSPNKCKTFSKNYINLKNYRLCFSKNKDKLIKKNGIKGNSDLYHCLDKLIKQINNDDIFNKYKNKNKRNKLSIKTNEYFPLKKILSNENIIKKKNKTELNLKSFSTEINNYKKTTIQVLNNIDKMINIIKNV